GRERAAAGSDCDLAEHGGQRAGCRRSGGVRSCSGRRHGGGGGCRPRGDWQPPGAEEAPFIGGGGGGRGGSCSVRERRWRRGKKCRTKRGALGTWTCRLSGRIRFRVFFSGARGVSRLMVSMMLLRE